MESLTREGMAGGEGGKFDRRLHGAPPYFCHFVYFYSISILKSFSDRFIRGMEGQSPLILEKQCRM